LDNIFVGRTEPDQSPPLFVNSVWFIDTLQLSFNEPLDLTFTEVVWIEDPGVNIFFSEDNQASKMNVYFDQALTFGESYTLRVNNLRDLSGNSVSNLEIPFIYDPIAGPKAFDILISEIMAAPSDQTALPNAEYVELVNRSKRKVQLSGLQFTDGSRTAVLPEFVLEPGALVLLCDETDAPLFNDFNPVLGLPSFPGLNNGGDYVKLLSPNGRFIHGVNYTDDWYGDPSKDDGGWSLELLDTSYACIGAAGFQASNDSRGGSPASANIHSVATPQQPSLIEVELLSEQQCLIQFDQWMASTDMQDQEIITFEPSLGIDLFSIPSNEPNKIELIFDQALQKGQIYQFTLSAELKDCKLQALTSDLSGTIGIPELPDSANLQITEIMFDPATGGVQWVEIFNPTEKIYSWSDLYLSYRAPMLSDQVPLEGDDLILPKKYYVITEDPTYIRTNFEVPFPNQLRQQELPSMDRSEGGLRLEYISNTLSSIIEDACYDEQWHSGFVRETRGVSLERLDLSIEACEANNWQSAAETVGFGTPTGENSQKIESIDASEIDAFKLLSPTFSPDGDGFEDQMIFKYTNPQELEPPQLDLFVYSLDGMLIKTLANNLSVGTETQIIWDGTNTNNQMMAEGYYLIKARTYRDNGEANQWQATVYLFYSE